MATIPVYTQQVIPNSAGISPRASGSDAVGAALQGLGQTVEGSAVQASNILKVKEDENARAWTSSALSESHVSWTKRMQEMENQAEPGAPDFSKNVLSEFDSYKAEQLKNAPNARAKLFYGERLDALRTSLYGQAVGFEAQQATKWKVQQFGEASDNVASMAALDPEKAKVMLAEQEAIAGGYENKALAQHLIVGMREKASNAALTGMVERDPASALELIDTRMTPEGERKTGNIFLDNVDGEKLINLRHRAVSYIAQADNRNRAEDDKRLKEALTSVTELQKFTLTGQMVSPGYENQVKFATAGTPYADMANTLIQQSYAGAAYGSQPIPKQRASLLDLEAQAAKTGTDPKSSELIQKAREITTTQAKAYADNPWEAATRFARQAPEPVVQIQSADQVPQLIAQRIPRMTSIENYSGDPISPLQPAEADKFVEKLATLDPAARGAILSQTGAQLTAPRIEALADQLDKKNRPMALSMKLGSDMTTAGRSVAELVQRGAQSLGDKTIKKDDTVLTGWKATIAEYVRGTLGSDKAENDVIDSAYYVRAAMENDSSNIEGFKLGASEEKAISLVIGQPMERNGVKTLLPRGMNETAFDQALKAITPERLKTNGAPDTVYLRGQSITLQKFTDSLGRFGMSRDGSGNFIPSTAGAFVTLDKEGRKPLRLPITGVR